MKKWKTSAAAKAVAFILCALSFTACLVSSSQVLWLNENGGLDSRQVLMDRMERSILWDWLGLGESEIGQAIQDTGNSGQLDLDQLVRQLTRVYEDRDPNLFFTLRDANGKLLASSQELGDYRGKLAREFTLPEVTKVSEIYDSLQARHDALEALYRDYDEVWTENVSDDNQLEGVYHLYAVCYNDPDEGEMAVEETGKAIIDEVFSTPQEWLQELETLKNQYDHVEYQSPEDISGYLLNATALNYDKGKPVTLTVFIRYELTPYGDIYHAIHRAAAVYATLPLYIALIAAGAVVGLLSLLFLLWSAGHEKDTEGIALRGFDQRAPIDILLPAGICALAIWFAAGWEAATGQFVPGVFPVTAFLLLSLTLAFAVETILSALRRSRAKAPQKETLFFSKVGKVGARAVQAMGRGFRRVGRSLAGVLGKLPLFWGAALVFLACTVLEGLWIIGIVNGSYFAVILWFLLKILECVGVIYMVLSLRKLQDGGRELAAGHLDYKVPLDQLKWAFREHGEHLNSIRTAIQAAVEDQMKSERMKTELITNVSHDIKTPLTSIVSYVDLLKKQEMPTPEAREYLEVLDRQSARLKKLTEDLVDASKASTGNLTVDLQRTDVNVLLTQSAGEYQERLKAKTLTLLLTPAASNPAINADGRLLWRVFDNLLSNIHKYAQPGTRVYLTCEADNDTVTILFRNISARELNLSADELMERFVRGDEARSTEGSGLGLSIARSLTQLQNGTFDLAIDGDLFKAILTFPRIP